MKRSGAADGRFIVAVLGLGIIAALAAWKLWPAEQAPSDQSDASGTQPAPAPTTLPAGASSGREEALKAYEEGLTLWRQEKIQSTGKNIVEARNKLSQAFFSGHLTEAQQDKLVPTLTLLAEKTLLQGNFYDGDPYVSRHLLQPGEMLGKLEREKALHVPTELLEKVNHTEAKKMRAGKQLVLVHGPFHAIVRKSRFVMDVYLEREGWPKVFVRRFSVGLGSTPEATPVGSWRVQKGKKLKGADWNPPPSSAITKKIKFGEPGYPLGKMGYWISLEGTDPKTKMIDSIGIHGTNDPSSIGKAQSLGCIRMRDEDIDWVYAMLYVKWSTVRIVP